MVGLGDGDLEREILEILETLEEGLELSSKRRSNSWIWGLGTRSDLVAVLGFRVVPKMDKFFDKFFDKFVDSSTAWASVKIRNVKPGDSAWIRTASPSHRGPLQQGMLSTSVWYDSIDSAIHSTTTL
jgi:hypothetical protein